MNTKNVDCLHFKVRFVLNIKGISIQMHTKHSITSDKKASLFYYFPENWIICSF